MKRFGSLMWLLGLAVVGCQTGTYEDPNDPVTAGILAPDVIRRQLKGTSDMLMERVAKGTLTDEQFRELIAKRANELLKDLPIDKIDPARAWEYGEVFRTAKKWDLAEKALKIAVDHAASGHNEDRRVNDLLRLAHAQAMLNKVPEAIANAKKTMNVAPEGSAPILPAVLLEIVPAARNKGHDAELAALLEQAIGKHATTVVDPHSDAGTAFLIAKPHHIQAAWRLVVELYAKAGKSAEAAAALAKGEKMMDTMHRV